MNKEVRIPKELRGYFSEVRILMELPSQVAALTGTAVRGWSENSRLMLTLSCYLVNYFIIR